MVSGADAASHTSGPQALRQEGLSSSVADRRGHTHAGPKRFAASHWLLLGCRHWPLIRTEVEPREEGGLVSEPPQAAEETPNGSAVLFFFHGSGASIRR